MGGCHVGACPVVQACCGGLPCLDLLHGLDRYFDEDWLDTGVCLLEGKKKIIFQFKKKIPFLDMAFFLTKF